VLQPKKLPVQEKEMQNLRQKQEKKLHVEENVLLEEELLEEVYAEVLHAEEPLEGDVKSPYFFIFNIQLVFGLF
jgi:hypothetical protein